MLGSWAAGVRPYLLGQPHSGTRLQFLQWSRDPSGHPSLLCPSLYALCGHDQWMMEPRKGEPRGHPPHLRESMTPVLSSGWGRRRSPSCPLHRAGLREPLLVLSSHPHWAFLPPGANLGNLEGLPRPFFRLLGPGSWVSPAIPQRSGPPPALLGLAHSGQWRGTQPGAGSFPLGCSRRPPLATQPHMSLTPLARRGEG